MENTGNIQFIASIISLLIAIVILIRWWGMTSNIKDIRNYLYRQNIPEIEQVEVDNQLIELEKLKIKMKPNQLIIKILANQRLEVWDKSTWDEHISQGKGKFFEELYKNY